MLNVKLEFQILSYLSIQDSIFRLLDSEIVIRGHRTEWECGEICIKDNLKY